MYPPPIANNTHGQHNPEQFNAMPQGGPPRNNYFPPAYHNQHQMPPPPPPMSRPSLSINNHQQFRSGSSGSNSSPNLQQFGMQEGGLPLPYQGQGQYSHQVNTAPMQNKQDSVASSAHTSRKPSPVPTKAFDAIEGQFPSARSSPHQYPQQGSTPPPSTGPSLKYAVSNRGSNPLGPPPMHPPPNSNVIPADSQSGPAFRGQPCQFDHKTSGSPQQKPLPYPCPPGTNSNHNLSHQMSQIGLESPHERIVNLMQRRELLTPKGDSPPTVQLKNSKVRCSPNVMRCTLNAVPPTDSLLSKVRLPLGLLLQPYRTCLQTPLTLIQPSVIVRCRSCRTYINPYVSFPDNRRWKCNVCFRLNDLPDEFQYDPISKVYGEPHRRPEIRSASVEFVAPSEYMLRPPQAAVYVFLLDVSRIGIATGYLEMVASCLREQMANLPGDSRKQIAFMTYNSGLHFYKLSGNIPRMLICTDVDEVFLPDHEGLIVNVHENVDTIIDLLTHLPQAFTDACDAGNCLGSALKAAYKLISSSGGRITVFNSCLPNVGPGILKSREDNNQRAATTIDHLGPQTDFYKTFALECAGQQIAVDMFLVSSHYTDLTSLAGAARHSGGSVFHYPEMMSVDMTVKGSASKEANLRRRVEMSRFERDFNHYLNRKLGLEAVLRVRCSRGIGIQAFHGNCFVRSTDLLSLPNVSPDAGFAIQLSIEDSLAELSTVCFQSALLYTSSQGERRIRVHTLCLPLTTSVEEIYHSADGEAIACLLAKMAVDRSINSSVENARQALLNACVDALSGFGKHCLGSSSHRDPVRELACPYHLRLLPLLVSALLHSTAFRLGVSTKLDLRCAAMEKMKNLPIIHLLAYIYPKLYPLHVIGDDAHTPLLKKSQNGPKVNSPSGDEQNDDPISESQQETLDDLSLPGLLHLSSQFLNRTGVYLLDSGEQLLLLVGSGVSQDFCLSVFGVDVVHKIPDGGWELPALTNQTSRSVRAFIRHLQSGRPYCSQLCVIKEDSPYRSRFLERLFDDRADNMSSYYEFMQQLSQSVKYS